MTLRDQVVLVDAEDRSIGVMDKMQAHQEGLLHRAFSVFIFNNRGEILIHQRAASKYHGGNLWTNACCSHPQLDEEVHASAQERLAYEMGLHCDLYPLFAFTYRVEVENNLIEHEYDHVFYGITDSTPKPQPQEVQNYEWIAVEKLLQRLQQHPEQFTYWFRSAIPTVLAHLASVDLGLQPSPPAIGRV